MSPQCTDTRVGAADVRAALLLLLRTHSVSLPRCLPLQFSVDGTRQGSRIYRQLCGIPQGANLSSVLCALFYAKKDRHPEVQRLLKGRFRIPKNQQQQRRGQGAPATPQPLKPHAGAGDTSLLPSRPFLDAFELLWRAGSSSSDKRLSAARLVPCGPFLVEFVGPRGSQKRRLEMAQDPIPGPPSPAKKRQRGLQRKSQVAPVSRQHPDGSQEAEGHKEGTIVVKNSVASSGVDAVRTPEVCHKCSETCRGASGRSRMFLLRRSLLQRVRKILLPPLLLRWVDDFIFVSPGVSAAQHFLRLLTQQQLWGPNVNAQKLKVESHPAGSTKAAAAGAIAMLATHATPQNRAAPEAAGPAEAAAAAKPTAAALHKENGPAPSLADLTWAGLKLTIPSAGLRLACRACLWRQPEQMSLRDSAALRRRKGCAFMAVSIWRTSDCFAILSNFSKILCHLACAQRLLFVRAFLTVQFTRSTNLFICFILDTKTLDICSAFSLGFS